MYHAFCKVFSLELLKRKIGQYLMGSEFGFAFRNKCGFLSFEHDMLLQGSYKLINTMQASESVEVSI